MSTKNSKKALTVRPPHMDASHILIGRITYDLTTKEFANAKLAREYNSTVKYMATATTAVSTALYELSKSLARVERNELYKDQFESVYDYAKYAYSLDDKASSTISGYLKAGREYLDADALVLASEKALANSPDDETLRANLDHAKQVREIHATLSPSAIAEIREGSALNAVSKGDIKQGATQAELRALNTAYKDARKAESKPRATVLKKVRVITIMPDFTAASTIVMDDTGVYHDNQLDSESIGPKSLVYPALRATYHTDKCKYYRLLLKYDLANNTTRYGEMYVAVEPDKSAKTGRRAKREQAKRDAAEAIEKRANQIADFRFRMATLSTSGENPVCLVHEMWSANAAAYITNELLASAIDYANAYGIPDDLSNLSAFTNFFGNISGKTTIVGDDET